MNYLWCRKPRSRQFQNGLTGSTNIRTQVCHFKNILHLLKVLRWRLHHNFTCPLQRREKENKKETHFCLNIDIQLIDRWWWWWWCVCVLLSCVSCSVVSDSLWHPMDCSPLGFSVHGILQTRILEWVAIPFSRGSSQPRDRTQASCIAGRFFYQLSYQGSPSVW